MINYHSEKKIFHLQGKNTSYFMQVNQQGHLFHLYWGKRLEDVFPDYLLSEVKRASYIADTDQIKEYKLERLPQEYPAFGNSDLRKPAYEIVQADGSRISDFRYNGHRILTSKPEIAGLPSLRAAKDAETLVIELVDELTQIRLELYYTCYFSADILTRHVRIVNAGDTHVTVQQLNSASVELAGVDYELLHLSGSWARECHIQRQSLTQMNFVLESTRGSSSHEHNPFMALVTPETTETHGDVYAMNLVYSGNFRGTVEVEMQTALRMQMGLNPFQFAWQLTAGTAFETPEVVLVYAENGLQEMTHKFHEAYREYLLPENFAKELRPILINSWEACYFDLQEEALLNLAKKSQQLGVELFVLDDGWFGKRDDDTSSLGDWEVNRQKFSAGLGSFSEKIKALGLQFGLWVEPEMISEKSNLFKLHPEWCVAVPGRLKSLSRNQFVLDLCRVEVQDYLIETFAKIFTEAKVDYVKWDMNRSLTEAGSQVLAVQQQGEFYHRYILGLYRVVATLTQRFPKVLFENCAGGGGRFDAGMLAYMPQTWTSDDTDAIERLAIQAGTSLVYPTITMGAHVSAAPNHQVGRQTSLKTRGIVAMQGNFGYELDVTKLTPEEEEILKAQIAFYKEIRQTVQLGKLYRLPVPQKGNAQAWEYLSQESGQVVVSYVQILARPNTVSKRLRLTGLKPQAHYLLPTGELRSGGELMQLGLAIDSVKEDYYSQQWLLKEIKE